MKKKILLLSLIPFLLFAKITLKADKNKIGIGEPLEVTIELYYKESMQVDYSQLEPNEKFVKTKDTVLSVTKENGYIKEVKKRNYSLFEEKGDYVFGPLSLIMVDKSNKEVIESSDSIKIEVVTLLNDSSVTIIDSLGTSKNVRLDSLNTILPIKDIVKYKMSRDEKLMLLYMFLGIIATIVIIYFILKRKKKIKPRPQYITKKIIPSHISAIIRLKELKNKKYDKDGNYKLFAIEISMIIREYIEERFDFYAAEMTSYDLKNEILKYVDDKSVCEDFNTFIDKTDLVKFAKYIPLFDELDKFYSDAENFIIKTKEESDEIKVVKLEKEEIKNI